MPTFSGSCFSVSRQQLIELIAQLVLMIGLCQARLVELRYFGGLTSEQAAVALGVSLTTAKREWNMAKAWLYRRLSQTARPGT